MVILQFNKLIRNKWVWGVFAILVSAFFCFDDAILRDREEREVGSVGTLAGKSVSADLFNEVAGDLRGLGRNRDWKRAANEVNRDAWEMIAALETAERNGIAATDAEVQESIRRDGNFQANGGFSFALYNRLLRENGLTPEHYEAFLRRQLTLERLGMGVLEGAAWVSPAELDRAVADMTDVFTVRVASFKQDKAAADKVTIDEAGVRKWYDEHAKSLALPERVKIRMVRYSADDKSVLAKMTVTDDELHDYFDTNGEKFTKSGTNGTDKVQMTFDEAKEAVERELRRIAAVQYYETNLNSRAYGVKAAKGASRLDEIAKEDGLKVAVSEWFTVDGGYVDGFMRHASAVCPGAEGFESAVAELDADSEDLRYAVVSSPAAVWLVELAGKSPAHTPDFDEAKDVIRPRALEAAKDDAFKAAVEAVAKKGVDAVLAGKDVSTNLTFSIEGMTRGAFDNQYAVASAARKLAKGEVSEFFRTGRDSAILVVCVDRKAGDATQVVVTRNRVREQVAMLSMRQLPDAWRKWNLARLGFEADAGASVDAEDADGE